MDLQGRCNFEVNVCALIILEAEWNGDHAIFPLWVVS